MLQIFSQWLRLFLLTQKGRWIMKAFFNNGFNNHLKPFLTKLQLPLRKVNQDYSYRFYLYPWKTEGMIFLTTALLIPLLFLFIFRFAVKMSTSTPVIDNSYLQLIYWAITLGSATIGFYQFYHRDKQLFLQSGTFVFYCFILVPNLISFAVTLIASLAGVDNNSPVAPFLTIWSQILAEVLVLFLAFRFTTNLKNRILTTLKENWLMVLIVVVISAGVLFGLTQGAYQAIFKNTPLSLNEQSKNQQGLENGLETGLHPLAYRIFYAFSLFVLTIVVAPLCEEIATRNAWFTGVGNKTLGLVTTALFFGILHTQTGDVEHILNYVLAGLILGSIFLVGRGNVTYDWLTHATYNLVVLIIMFSQKF